MRAEGSLLYRIFKLYMQEYAQGVLGFCVYAKQSPKGNRHVIQLERLYSLKIVENMIWNSMLGDKMLFIPICASGVELAANSKTFTRQQKRSKIQYMHGKAWDTALAGGSVHPNWIIKAGLGINVECELSKCFFLMLCQFLKNLYGQCFLTSS